MRNVEGILAAVVALGVAGCGESTRTVKVNLTASSLEMVDPFHPDANLARLRIVVDGVDSGDAIRDLALTERSATFEGLPSEGAVNIRVFGYDEVGSTAAYGQRIQIEEEGDLDVTIPFRRNLAYVTHHPDAEAQQPGAQIYILDMVTRAYVGKVTLPDRAATARRISARGGAEMLVPYDRDGAGFLGVLDLDDHTWKTISLEAPQELALAVEGSPVAVVAGGNRISFVDVDTGAFLETFRQMLGGRILDGAMSGDGGDAVFVVDQEPGSIFVDVAAREVTARNVVAMPGGVGLRREGDIAYFSSLGSNTVTAIDLASGNATAYEGADASGGSSAYADGMSSVIAVRDVGGVLADIVALFLTVEPTTGSPLVQSVSIGKTLVNPVPIVVDGSGQRLLVAASGNDDSPAGMTVIVGTALGEIPAVSSALYPTDPDDLFMEPNSEILVRRRYRPRSAAIVYGR